MDRKMNVLIFSIILVDELYTFYKRISTSEGKCQNVSYVSLIVYAVMWVGGM